MTHVAMSPTVLAGYYLRRILEKAVEKDVQGFNHLLALYVYIQARDAHTDPGWMFPTPLCNSVIARLEKEHHYHSLAVIMQEIGDGNVMLSMSEIKAGIEQVSTRILASGFCVRMYGMVALAIAGDRHRRKTTSAQFDNGERNKVLFDGLFPDDKVVSLGELAHSA